MRKLLLAIVSFVLLAALESSSFAGGFFFRSGVNRPKVNYAPTTTHSVCQVPVNQPTALCVVSSSACCPPANCPSEVTLPSEVAECCAVVKSAETVVGDERTKLDGLRWDMIKIKEKVNVELTEEEKTIAKNPRP